MGADMRRVSDSKIAGCALWCSRACLVPQLRVPLTGCGTAQGVCLACKRHPRLFATRGELNVDPVIVYAVVKAL